MAMEVDRVSNLICSACELSSIRGELLLRIGWTRSSAGAGGKEEGAQLVYKMFGPKFFAVKALQSPPAGEEEITSLQDVTLAAILMAPGCKFREELSAWPPVSESGYGSVEKVYIVCGKDQGITEQAQRRMMENNPVKVVKAIEDADQMPMTSAPKQLYQLISDIAEAYL